VTAKGAPESEDRLSEFAWPYFALYALMLAGAGVAAYRCIAEPGVRQLMVFVGLWNVFNLVTAGVALGAVAERRRSDRNPRLAIERRGVLSFDGKLLPVAIDEASADGCRLRVADVGDTAHIDRDAPSDLRLFVESGDATLDRPSLPVVAMTIASDGTHHASFGALQPRDHLALADLIYGDAAALARFVAARRKHKGILAGTAQFLLWGVVEPMRALAYLRRRAPSASDHEPPPFADLSTFLLQRFFPHPQRPAPMSAPATRQRIFDKV
jgi:cellulose synthase (UDP-forming)